MAHTLDTLYEIVLARKEDKTQDSYTASLYQKGRDKIAQKVGEEAVETVIEGIKGDKARLTYESADLLYHLMILWADNSVHADDVWQELQSRMK